MTGSTKQVRSWKGRTSTSALGGEAAGDGKPLHFLYCRKHRNGFSRSGEMFSRKGSWRISSIPVGFTEISPYLGIHLRAKDTSHMPRPRKRMLNNGVRGLRNDGRWQITLNYRVPFDLNRNISSRRSTSHPSRTGRRWPSSHATEKGSTPVVARDEGEAATGDEMRTSSGELLFSVAPQIRCPVDPHDGGLPCFWRRLAHPLAGGVGG